MTAVLGVWLAGATFILGRLALGLIAVHVLSRRTTRPAETTWLPLAEALARAMTDDALVDAAAQKNLELVRRIASRDLIRPRVIEFYEHLLRRV